jgi:hypothetical protein
MENPHDLWIGSELGEEFEFRIDSLMVEMCSLS